MSEIFHFSELPASFEMKKVKNTSKILFIRMRIMNINTTCQVFTPNPIVKDVLNQVGYVKNLYDRKLLENSCGDGAFLTEAIDRYIKDCIKNKISKKDIVDGLENDIYATEIDQQQIDKCLENLNKIATKHAIKNVKWNIAKADVLKSPPSVKFDFIVGNPPYIKYADLDIPTRNFIRKSFEGCSKGKPDYYYAFIELSLRLLKHTGKLGYLIPNNIFKNQFGENIRTMMLPHLSKIKDFKSKKLFKEKTTFKDILTSSSIIICEGKKHNRNIIYLDATRGERFTLRKKSLVKKWIFTPMIEQHDQEHIPKRRFGDDFKATASIATLLNEAFIIRDYETSSGFAIAKGKRIEMGLLKEGVSPRSLFYDNKELLIFPYHYDENGDLIRYSDEELSSLFPEGRQYLLSYLDKLNKRTKDKKARWFEFGRSQALQHLNQRKLLMSTLVTQKVRIHSLSKEQIPYAGICIFQKGALPLEHAIEILQRQEFLDYLYNIGINASGNTVRVTAKDVENFEYVL